MEVWQIKGRKSKVDERSLAQIAKASGTSKQEIKRAIEDLERKGLAKEEKGRIVLSPLAMRRATSVLGVRQNQMWVKSLPQQK